MFGAAREEVTWVLLHTGDFGRKGAAIACRRFKGRHTYEKITEMINEIHNEYVDKTKTKIMKTVTDNGSNFAKALAESRKNKMIVKELANIELDKAKEIEVGDDCDDDKAEYEDEMMLIPISDILEIGNGENIFESNLPDHQRCASHTLNFLPTTNSKKCLGTKYPQYTRLRHSAFGKCSAIWNLTSRSPKQAEIYFAITGKHPTSPCPTRWNTAFDCQEDLKQIKGKLNAVCDALNLPKFQENEMEFLMEYLEILRPIAEAIDKLQGSKNTFFGELIPQLFRTKKILESLSLKHLKFCAPLQQTLLQNLEKRFSQYFALLPEANDAILATIPHSHFKLKWAPRSKRVILNQLLFQEMRNFSKDNKESSISRIVNEGKEEIHIYQYYMFDESKSTTSESGSDTPNTSYTSRNFATKKNSLQLEALHYLQEEDISFSCLNRYPIIKELFHKYNTTLPSSAPVQRLFSYAGMILRPKRRSMGYAIFEKQLLLKANESIRKE